MCILILMLKTQIIYYMWKIKKRWETCSSSTTSRPSLLYTTRSPSSECVPTIISSSPFLIISRCCSFSDLVLKINRMNPMEQSQYKNNLVKKVQDYAFRSRTSIHYSTKTEKNYEGVPKLDPQVETMFTDIYLSKYNKIVHFQLLETIIMLQVYKKAYTRQPCLCILPIKFNPVIRQA